MPAVIRRYHGLIACTISVFTLQLPWNFQLQQQEQTPCSQQIQISQKQNKTGFSCVLLAAVYPKIGELLTSPPSEPYKQTLPWSEATHIQFQPELSKGTFPAQTDILTLMINRVDFEDLLVMQGMLNSLAEGFVQFVFFHVLDTVVQIYLGKQDSAPAVIIAGMPGHWQTGLQTCLWGAAESQNSSCCKHCSSAPDWSM